MYKVCFLIFSCFIICCTNTNLNEVNHIKTSVLKNRIVKTKSKKNVTDKVNDTVQKKLTDTSALEKYLISKKLINLQELDPSVRVVLHYSTSQNFLHKPIYKGLTKCYLPCEVSIKLCNAQFYLHQQNSQYHIIVFDAVRPLYIQKQMWDELNMPLNQKINYLAFPGSISLHNYGAAVDVGIIGPNNVLLDMGTDFDSFNELSQPKKEKQFLKEGKLTASAYANRLLLRKVMVRAGFIVMNTEWWHFNSTNKVTAAARYELIE